MPTANESLLDATVRHEIGLRRYSNKTIRLIIGLLNRIDNRIVNELANRQIGDSSFTQRRLELLLDAVRTVMVEGYKAATGRFDDEIKALSGYEVEWQADLLSRIPPVKLDIVTPGINQLYAAVHSRPFQGRIMKEWYKDLEANAFKRVRDEIRMGYVEGRTNDQIIRAIRGTRTQQYRDGILEINRRGAETMVRTAINHTANTARTETYKQNKGVVKGVQWVSTLDLRTSAICRARDGKVYPVDEGPRPPAHPNCLPGNTLVASRFPVTGASKHRFDGQLVVIRTATGKELSCTPNHPILTDCGWVAAHLLNEGDNVVCDGGSEWGASAINMDHENMPTRIHDVVEAFLSSSQVATVPVPTTAKDFHGDGMDGDVAIIGTNGLLTDGGNASLVQDGDKGAFVMRDTGLVSLSRLGALDHFFHGPLVAANRVVSRLRQFGAFLRACTFHASKLLFGPIARFNAVVAEYAGDSARGDVVTVGNARNSYATIKEADCFFDRDLNAWAESTRPQRLAAFFEASKYCVDADAKLASDILCGSTGPVFLDDVVQIERRNFSGHVFNLETEKAFYSAQGIITHNCRSTTVPVLKSWKELGISLKEAPKGTRASMDGQVAEDLTYNDWLKKQSAHVQDDVLGKTKADLYRKGGLTMDRFVDETGHEYTLDELRRREKAAWNKAGLGET